MTTQALVPPSLRPAPIGGPRLSFGRLLPFALAVAGAAAFVAALAQPWWKFILYAPQYPHGLRLDISLGGLAGDVHEIGMLNHYIGMKHLEDAATFERAHAAVGVAAVAVASFAVLFWHGRRPAWWTAGVAALLPLGFLSDSFFWLYRFGHELDPRAPVHIPGFTPQLFGNGQIGQFMTFAEPALGFWIAVGGAALFGAASLLRQKTYRTR
jgi:hypothetical protein